MVPGYHKDGGLSHVILTSIHIAYVLQPKFLTKQEREAAALARRQQQVNQQKKDLDDLRKKQRDIFEEGKKLLGELVFETSSDDSLVFTNVCYNGHKSVSK